MAITLVATAGSASANAYLDVVAAQAYFDARLGSDAWPTNVEEQKAALISATNRLDQEVFEGTKTDPDVQRLKWPRTGVYDTDGVQYDDATIPREIQEAVCEIALVILGDATKLGGSDLDQFSALSVGAISITMRANKTTSNDLPSAAWRLVSHLIGAGSGQIRLQRG